MAAYINQDLIIDQNAENPVLVNGQVPQYIVNGAIVSLVGWTATLMIRINKTDVGTVLVLSTTIGGIVLGGLAGTVAITISHANANLLAAALPGGAAFYDCLLYDTFGNQTRFMQGAITIDPAVTR